MNINDSTNYEIMVILKPDLGEKGQEEALTDLRTLISSIGGEIYHEDIWGIRDLAYRIKKQDQGFYAVFNFKLENGEGLKEVNETLNLEQSVVRYLVIKTPVDYSIKTLAEYTTEAEAEELEEQRKKEEKMAKNSPPKAKKREEKKEVKIEKPKKVVKEKPEAVKEEAPKKKEKKAVESKKKLEEVDEKLKDIINDPDISL